MRESHKRIAVMQPYFFPYAGYFRLLAAADEFVILDCVQFARRGRVHRCEVPGPTPQPSRPSAAPEWLTLPLAKAPRDTRIMDLAFAPDAQAELARRLDRLPWYRAAQGEAALRVRAHLAQPLPTHPGAVVDVLESGLRLVAALLGLTPQITRSSQLALPASLKGEARIIEIAKARQARRYINAPGGRALYDAQSFAREGLELAFLEPYDGPFVHLLPALLREDPARIAADVRRGL